MATRKLASTRQILNGDYDREIYEAMARAMFVSDWADRQEEKGKTYPGMDLMDVAPPTSRDALLAARALAAAVIKDNNVKSLTDLYARALNAGGEGDARKFGHYLAMQAMGHGVSWYDDGNPEFGLKLPHFEYYSDRGRAAQKLGHASGRRRIVHNPNLGQHDPARPLTEAERDALDESAAEGRAERWAGARAMGLNADDAYEHAIGSGRGRGRRGHASGVRAKESTLTREQRAIAPHVRAFDNGSSFTATVSEAGIDAFTRSWPASGIRDLRGVSFMFDKRNGDLEDIRYKNGTPEDWDGPALVALSEDAQAVARTRLKIAGLASGRSGRKGLSFGGGATHNARLFIGVFPGGISYADRTVEEHGDYKKLAFLPYDTLVLDLKPGVSAALAKAIKAHAATIRARKGQHFATDTSGHYVVLGKSAKGHASGTKATAGHASGKKARTAPAALSLEDTKLSKWSERDRNYVGLLNKKTDKVIIEWWDDDANQAVEDGFLDPKRLHRSAFEYAQHVGLIAGGKGLASGSKAKAKGGHMLRIYDKKDATRLVRETHHTSRARALKSRDDFERRHGRHPHAIDAADAKGLASGSKAKIPANFPVKVLRPGQRAKDKVTCGTCGRSWDDAISTSMTPTPSGRCPFEHFHKGLASGSKAKAKRTRVKASCACSATAVTRKKRSHS